VKVAVIGNGSATGRMHLPALRRLSEAELVGGCDADPERRAAWGRETGTPAFESADELLQRCRPEVAIVATPPDSHAALAIASMQSGAHVLCEKPLADSLSEADRILAAARGAGRRVAVNQHMRRTRIFKALRERIESGADGRLVFCQVTQLLERGAELDGRAEWKRAMADRQLLEGGIHLVDLVNYLHGSPPAAVTAQLSPGEGGGGADPIALITFEYPGGELAQLTMQRLFPADTRYVEVRADCERASLGASLGGRALLRVGKERAHHVGARLELAAGGLSWIVRGNRTRTLARDPRPADVHAAAALLEDAIDAFRRDREPCSSGLHARDALAVVDAAYRSAAEGRRVGVPVTPPVVADHATGR
jgi:UDP-N-acetyl-2-amino-2-deoxyglucuronate dehydrogenase